MPSVIPIQYLSRNKASLYLLDRHGLKRSAKYLAKLASAGNGPAFHKAGRDALYSPTDLDAWATKLIGPGAFSAVEHRLAETVAA
jgi:hypothetical protein